MKLDDQSISSLSRLSDPVGVLSVYVGIPVERANDRPAWPLEVKTLIKNLEDELRSTLPAGDWNRVHDRISDLQPELDRLVSPRSSGRGRALFATVSNGHIDTFSLQLELPTRVVFDKTAFLLPLVAALDEGRPAGMVTMHRDGLHVFEWRLEETEELAHLPFEPATDEWRLKHGPVEANPLRGQQSVTSEKPKKVD